jgi:hypothetical protein
LEIQLWGLYHCRTPTALGLSRLLQLRFKPLDLRRYLLYLLFLLHVLAACSTKQSMELEVRGKYAFLGQKAVIVLGGHLVS